MLSLGIAQVNLALHSLYHIIQLSSQSCSCVRRLRSGARLSEVRFNGEAELINENLLESGNVVLFVE